MKCGRVILRTFYAQNIMSLLFNHLSANPENGQTHSNSLLASADELFECVWTFCRVDAESVNPFQTIVPRLCPLKTSENHLFFGGEGEIWKQNIGLKWVSILNWQLSAPFWNLLFRKSNCLQSPHKITKKWTECKAKLRNFQGCITHRRNFI